MQDCSQFFSSSTSVSSTTSNSGPASVVYGTVSPGHVAPNRSSRTASPTGSATSSSFGSHFTSSSTARSKYAELRQPASAPASTSPQHPAASRWGESCSKPGGSSVQRCSQLSTTS